MSGSSLTPHPLRGLLPALIPAQSSDVDPAIPGRGGRARTPPGPAGPRPRFLGHGTLPRKSETGMPPQPLARSQGRDCGNLRYPDDRSHPAGPVGLALSARLSGGPGPGLT
eukprot:297268-Hanusia_phi.AAC.1